MAWQLVFEAGCFPASFVSREPPCPREQEQHQLLWLSRRCVGELFHFLSFEVPVENLAELCLPKHIQSKSHGIGYKGITCFALRRPISLSCIVLPHRSKRFCFNGHLLPHHLYALPSCAVKKKTSFDQRFNRRSKKAKNHQKHGHGGGVKDSNSLTNVNRPLLLPCRRHEAIVLKRRRTIR